MAASHPAALAVLLFTSTLGVMAGSVVMPVLEVIRSNLGLTGTAAGLIITAPGLAIAVTSPLVGKAVDHWSARVPLATGLVLYGTAGGAGLVVIEQPEMHDENPRTYDLRPAQGEVRRFDGRTPLEQALRQVGAIEGDQAGGPAEAYASSSFLLPTVVLAGLADGINPCASAVMAFFAALLFALRRSRLHILQLGSLYIVGMFVTYFALGLGLLQVLTAIGQPHFVTQVGGALAIAFGLVQIKDGLFPGLPLHLTVPKPGWALIQSWAGRANQPGAAVLGGLVGLCTLPCSGGIYLAVLGLLSARASYVEGLGYLALYNVAFVLPLAAILATVSSRPASLALATWEREHTTRMHLFAGAAMVALGAFMLGHLS